MSAVAEAPAPAPERAEAPPTPRAARPRGVRRPRLDAVAWRELVLVLLLLLCYGFFRQVPAWNEFSRYDLVVALVDDHTTRIDRYHANTGDKALYNGHYYSDKAPGSALLGVPVYALIRAVSNLTGAGRPDPGWVVQALAFAVSGIPTALLSLLLLRFLRPQVGEWWAYVVSVGYALGSMAFPFATMYFGHAASSFFLFAAFYVLYRSRGDTRWWLPLLAGVLAGWGVLTEFPVALGVPILAAYALWLSRRHVALFILGGIPCLAFLLAFNWIQFDSPFRLSYAYHVTFGQQMQEARGLFGITLPRLQALKEILVEPRGLLLLSPWLSLAPLGLGALRRRAVRAETLVCAAVVGGFLFYNGGFFTPMGGWTPGPRYLTPALPFATVLVALAPRAFRPLIALQIAYSVALFMIATTTMPNAPELYRDPLSQLWLPRFLNRDLAETIAWTRWGFHGIQPLFILALGLGLAAIALLATTSSQAAARRLTGGVAGVLVLLVVAFALPFTPPGALAADLRPERPAGTVSIVDAGITPALVGDTAKLTLWAQLENEGPAFGDTQVVFTVFTPEGKPTWSSWHGNVTWRAGERKRLAVEWSPKDAPPGLYRVGITVVSTDRQNVYARVDNAGVVRVRP